MKRQKDFTGTGSYRRVSSRAGVIQCELCEPLAVPSPQEASVLALALEYFLAFGGQKFSTPGSSAACSHGSMVLKTACRPWC